MTRAMSELQSDFDTEKINIVILRRPMNFGKHEARMRLTEYADRIRAMLPGALQVIENTLEAF